jgi:hypothetical protein
MKLVHRIIASHPEPGLHIQDIYKLALAEKPDTPISHEINPVASPPLHPLAHDNGIGNGNGKKGKVKVMPPVPPHLEHPIRSMRCVFCIPPTHSYLTSKYIHHTCRLFFYRYLKSIILPALAEQNKVKKIHVRRTHTPEELEQRLSTLGKTAKAGRKTAKKLSSSLAVPTNAWVWCLVSPEEAAQLDKKKREEEAEDLARRKAKFRESVSVGANWSHLNKRRARARLLKVGRDAALFGQLHQGANPSS